MFTSADAERVGFLSLSVFLVAMVLILALSYFYYNLLIFKSIITPSLGQPESFYTTPHGSIEDGRLDMPNSRRIADN